jgi:23S rRNA (cytidine1920-2'-O)/16S rRNA (cytidine1409-2'-O)-methyltransferase
VFWDWLTGEADLIVLIKPQFEAGKGQVGKGGVVRDPEVHRRVLLEVLSAAQEFHYTPRGLIMSPLKGPAGNIEFLAWLSAQQASTPGDVEDLITTALDGVPPDANDGV